MHGGYYLCHALLKSEGGTLLLTGPAVCISAVRNRCSQSWSFKAVITGSQGWKCHNACVSLTPDLVTYKGSGLIILPLSVSLIKGEFQESQNSIVLKTCGR